MERAVSNTPTLIAWRSTNHGRTWTRIEVHPRSPLAQRMPPPGHVYDDGYNLYRADDPDE